MDKRLANVEQREAEVSSSACSSSETKVPNKIRVSKCECGLCVVTDACMGGWCVHYAIPRQLFQLTKQYVLFSHLIYIHALLMQYHVREVYNNLLEEVDETFPGFDTT